MPTNRKRIARGRTNAGGLTEAAYIYFTWGDFFEAEGFEDGKSDDELKALWKKHREAIMERRRKEYPAHDVNKLWPIEKWEVVDNANK